ncbi:MAG: nitroreductase/quinone reductase family protein [Nitrososphaerales archaeon]
MMLPSQFHITLPFLYLTTKGWKTGKAHEIEIWYVEHEDKFYIISGNSEKSHWVQNVQHDANVTFRVKDRNVQGKGRVVTEENLVSKIKRLMNEAYKWSDGLIIELSAI